MKPLILLCLVSCVLLLDTSDGMTLNELKHEHVLIRSPENITFYYISATEIVVAWDLHQIYYPYDVTPNNYSRLSSGDKIRAGKPQTHLVAVNASTLNETSTEDKNATAANGTSSDVPSGTQAPSKNEDSVDTTGKESDQGPQEKVPSPWVCRAGSFFADYTIEATKDPGPFNNGWGTSILDVTRHVPMANVTILHRVDVEEQLVPFDKGCVVKFQVTYQPRYKKSVPAKTIDVGPHRHLATITGLTEATAYVITVQTVYVNDTVLKSKPHFVDTPHEEEKPRCNCDSHATVNQGSQCLNQTDGQLCQCKPEYRGRFCEECAPEYHRISKTKPCTKCPCEEYSKKHTSCRMEQGFLICNECQRGYAGNTCHKCDRGYYRHKDKCIGCYCNGNSDPKIPHMCEAETGRCISCIRNTTGLNCEACLPGYHGSPVTYRNCTLVDEEAGVPGKDSDSSLSPGIIAAITVGVLLCLGCIGFVLLKRLRSHQRRHAFWTVEMRRDKDDVDFNSVQNDDAHLDDLDDLEFYEHHGGTTSVSKYSRLNDQI